MKKVQFKHLIKTIMFLSLLVSVITIQHVSAQTSPSVLKPPIVEWCVVMEGKKEVNCSNYKAFNKDSGEYIGAFNDYESTYNPTKKLPQDIINKSLFVLNYPSKDMWGNNQNSKYYIFLEPQMVRFIDCNKQVYEIAAINEIYYGDTLIENKNGQKQEFQGNDDKKGPFRVIVTVKETKDTSSKALETAYENLPDCPVESTPVQTPVPSSEPSPVPTSEPTHQSFDVEYIPRNIIVHFHKENGAPDSIAVVDIGGKLLPTQLPKIKKEGYEFLGWYYKASDEYKLGPRGLDDELLPFDINRSIYADINLYAKWKQKEVVSEEPKKAVPNTADC